KRGGQRCRVQGPPPGNSRGGYAAAGKARGLCEGKLARSGSVLCRSSGRGWCPRGQLASGFPWKLSSPVELSLPSEAAAPERPAALDTLRLGFNIVGGTDQQYIANDSSIYVSWIKKDGAAYLDGRLQEGDKILAINGKDLKDLRHKDAVELFRNAGYYVSLKIQRRLQPQNGPVGHRGDGESGGLPLAAILVPSLALAATAVWILLRYRQRM
ncbi:synaptojanin-2-binding protein, partial [Cyanistes caeruleus]|uniref:synaptojanin-2-binding protein n=1 Tax=Cyanistes caeruleus TaxID=156563 RepID=UPI000CDA368D